MEVSNLQKQNSVNVKISGQNRADFFTNFR
jgi:hypothetical protein